MAGPGANLPPKARSGPDLESTADLIARARGGDPAAREKLAARYLPTLRRLAHGRIPSRARGLIDTDDIVQMTVTRALNHLDGFEPRREGAFLAYLRKALVNEIRDQARRAARRPLNEPLDVNLADPGPSPLEEAIGREAVEAYEAALARLSEDQREAIVLRVEMGFDYPEIADAMSKPTPNAARMVVARALVNLSALLRELREGR